MNNRNLIVRRVLMVMFVPPLTVGLVVSVVALSLWQILLDTKRVSVFWFDSCRDLWRGDR